MINGSVHKEYTKFRIYLSLITSQKNIKSVDQTERRNRSIFTMRDLNTPLSVMNSNCRKKRIRN